MKRSRFLLKLNIKSVIKSIPQLAAGAMVLIFLVSAIAFCGVKYLYGGLKNSADSSHKYSIGIVLNDDSYMASVVKDNILNMKQVSDFLNIDFTDEKKAMKNLENHKYLAVVIVPKNAAADIMNGTNTPITIVFPKNSGFESVLIKELTDSLGCMLSSAQAGIYSVYDFYDEFSASAEISDAVVRLNLRYINLVLSGEKTFNSQIVKATGNVPISTHYISAAIVLFLFLTAINIYGCLMEEPAYVQKRLSLNGTSSFMQYLIKYISIIFAYTIPVLVIFFTMLIVMPVSGIKMSLGFIILFFLGMPVFVLLCSAFVYLIFEITDNSMSRIMTTFLMTMSMSFISGCFIPSLMLPLPVLKLSAFVPTTYIMKFISAALTDHPDYGSLAICLLFALVMFLWGFMVKNIKRRDIK